MRYLSIHALADVIQSQKNSSSIIRIVCPLTKEELEIENQQNVLDKFKVMKVYVYSMIKIVRVLLHSKNERIFFVRKYMGNKV